MKIGPLTPGPLWAIQSPGFDIRLRDTCRLIPGMTWQPGLRAWVGYPDAVGEVAKRLNIPPFLPLLMWGASPDEALRIYQREGVSFIRDRSPSGCILADDVGLGKTATAISSLGYLEIGKATPACVVCPSFVRGVWKRELAKWGPSLTVHELWTTKGHKLVDNETGPDVYLVHYDILHAWVPFLVDAGVRSVVFDEAHYLQSAKSRRSISARVLANNCRHRIALTATPMTSRPKDLWNLVDTISPGRFGKEWDYYRRYCDARVEQVSEFRKVWKVDGTSNQEELNRRLKFLMLRRTKSDVSLELPARTRQIVEVDILKSKRVFPDSQSPAAMRAALDTAADGKVDELVELITSHRDAGSRVVVFCHRRLMAENLAGLVESPFIHGGMAQKKRDQILEDKPTVLVVTIDSTGVGVDLSSYNVAVFAELDWVPSKLIQAEGRLHRFGQKSPVLIQYVIAVGSVDELIASAVVGKLDTLESTVGGSDDGLKKDLAGGGSEEDQLGKLYATLAKMRVD